MNKRFLMALAAAACFGLLAILIVQRILVTKARSEGGKSVQIVFARTKIPIGTVISEGQLKAGSYVSADLPDGTFTDMRQVAGKIATADIEANLPITNKNIASSQHSILDSKLPEDKRAITIRVDEASGVAGFARPGSYVDVIAVMTPGSNARQISTTVAQSLRVLALGQETQVKNDMPSKIGNSVTLEASLAQAETLTLAMREGTLHLVLRNPTNQAIQPAPPVMIGNLIDVDEPKAQPRQEKQTIPLPPAVSPRLSMTPTPSPLPPVVNTASKLAQVKVYEGGKETTVTVRQ